MPTILLIEDEPDLSKILKSYLESVGMTVTTASRGDTGLSIWEQSHPDLIILDLNLPGKDGLDIAKEVRRRGETPIIMTTARVDETDRLIGLELGADDYIVKPYSPREVVARVKAVLRRSAHNSGGSSKITIGVLEVDVEEHTARKNGIGVDLTPMEFALLLAMMSQPGRAFSRMQLLEAAQGSTYEGYERTIDAHIKNLRAKIEDDPRQPEYIETVFGIGYRFKKQ